MSTTQAVKFTAPVDTSSQRRGALEEIFAHLIHELRQPLSTIEYCVCYAEMILSPDEGNIRAQLLEIQRQVEQANRILTAGAQSSPSGSALRLPEEEAETSRELTNAAMAAVT